MKFRAKAVWGMWMLGGFVLAAGCSGGGDGGMTPPTPTPPNPTSTNTITIANNAVSPKNIVVARGSQVTFVNSDNRTHDMSSNPHPEHTDCPEINQAGFLSPGQSRQTGNLNTVRTCGFHDHENNSNTGLQGTITIQ
jgi:plastocyanin